MQKPFHLFRKFYLLLTFLFASLFITPVTFAQSNETLRIGFQKSASLLFLLKSKGELEKALQPLGVQVKWVEFPAGPQLLEGLNVGSIDFGYVGEAPPIFAQAAGANFVYVGYEAPAPSAEAILIPKDSPIKNVKDLKGKKVALNKGSNVHYLLVKALEKSGLKYSDIQPIFLPPADARAAFDRGSVDAWVIWDPFLSAAEKQSSARVLIDGKGIANNHSFFLASRPYVEKNQKVIDRAFEVISKEGKSIKNNYRAAAQALSPLQGLEPNIIEQSLNRYSHDVRPINASVLAEQQKIADVFADLNLIPKKINVQEATPSKKQLLTNN